MSCTTQQALVLEGIVEATCKACCSGRQDVVMAVWRLGHITNSGRSAGGTVRHDAKLTVDSLSHAGNAEAE